MTRYRAITVNSFAEVPLAIQMVVQEVAAEVASMNFAPVLQDQIPWLEDLHISYFAAGAGPAGQWEPLKPYTIKRKGSSEILLDTHALVQSLAGTHPQAVRKVTSHELEFGTGIPYSIYHQQDEEGLGSPIRGAQRRVRDRRFKMPPKLSMLRAAVMGLSGLFMKGAQQPRRMRSLGKTRETIIEKRGGRRTGSGLPARPHVGLNDDSLAKLTSRIADGIVKRIGRQ